MKLRGGDHIICSSGHHVGNVAIDVPDCDPVPSEALSIAGPTIPDVRQGYICVHCDEVVAWLEEGFRWRVRTAQGWVE